jgi:tetratricopeptide (TPR) repeat protein
MGETPKPPPRAFRLALAAAAAITLSAALPASAQSPAEINLAKQTAGEGLAAYNANEFEKALGLFNQARKIYPSAQILRMIGYSEVGLEHWLKALEALEASLDAKISPLAKEDRKDVGDQIAKAMTHIGTITVTSKVPGAQLVVDGGDPRPFPLDKPLRLSEGPHKLVASAPEHLDVTNDLKVEGGKEATVALEPPPKPKALPPPPPPPPPPPKPTRKALFPYQREIGLAAAGAGVLAGVGALVTVIEAAHWRSMANADVNTHLGYYGQGCAMGDRNLCAYDIQVTNNEGNLANQLRNAAAGLGVTALVLGGGGIALFVLAPRPAKPAPTDAVSPPSGAPPPVAPAAPPPVSLSCGPGAGAGLFCRGTF